MIHKYAILAGVQKILGYNAKGEPRYLITPKAFREAGEYFAVASGMDRSIAARRAGHTIKVQDRNYTKFNGIRARDLADRYQNLRKKVNNSIEIHFYPFKGIE